LNVCTTAPAANDLPSTVVVGHRRLRALPARHSGFPAESSGAWSGYQTYIQAPAK
jgi:hypothetical protein